jgi:ribosomal protein L37AE/L43A
MAIPVAQLKTWSHQGSITQSKETYAVVKQVLEAPGTKYSNRSFEVFLQGSYGNDTNIYAESDVDVVIFTDSIYYYDVSELSPANLAQFNDAFSPASYSHAQFKTEVVDALTKAFGNDVSVENKAVKIKANGSRRNADVVIAAEFRRYFSTAYGPDFYRGMCFFDSKGKRIANYPKMHSANCTTKHQATGTWFKPMVRILKNMRSKLVADRTISDKCAPSYYLEGLLYNVPTGNFGTSYGDSFVKALNWILGADRTQFVCANERYYLVRDSSAVCWACADCDCFLQAVTKLWNNW